MSNFFKYKNLYHDKIAIFFGSGPTLENFTNFDQIKSDKFIKFGVNECIFVNDKLNLDYIVIGDYSDGGRVSQKECDKTIINQYKKNKNLKVICTGYREYLNHKIVSGLRSEINNKNFDFFEVEKREHSDVRKCPKPIFHIHENTRLIRYGSVSFDVIQLLLWMGFKKIVLIGHDSNYSKGTFFSKKENKGENDFNKVSFAWIEVKNYMTDFYDSVKIYQINPVALRNVYTTIEQDDIFKIL